MKRLFYKRSEVAQIFRTSTKTLIRRENDRNSDFPMPYYDGNTALYKAEEIDRYKRQMAAVRTERIVEMRRILRFERRNKRVLTS